MSIKFSDKSELIIGSTVIPENITFRFSDILKLGGSGGIDWKDITLSGNGSLTLVNAKANSLTSLKLFGGTEQLAENYIDSVTLDGKCEQSGTPTPTVPVDIVCNNGILKAKHQSGLPLGYQMVEWLKSTGGIIITGFKTKSTQEIETVFYRERSGASYLYSSDTATGGTTNTTAYLTSGAGNWRWDGKSYSISVPIGIQVTSIQKNDGVWLNGTQSGWYSNAGDFVSTYDLRLSSSENTTVRIYSQTIREGGIATLDLVPVQRLSDSSYGFYDKVGGEFYTNTEATFVAGDVIDDPVEIYTDGTVETATDNLGNVATAQMLLSTGNYKDTQEVLTGAVTRNVGIKVFDGTENWTESGTAAIIAGATSEWGAIVGVAGYSTHLIMLNTGETTYAGTCRFATAFNVYRYKTAFGVQNITEFKAFLTNQYNAGTPVIIVYPTSSPTTETVNGQFLSKEPVTVTGSLTGLVANVVSSTHTTPTPTQPLQINTNNGVLKVNNQGQIYTDGTVETVEVDTTGDTATAEMLLKVGDYQDVQNVINGHVTRNVGIKVLDGTESWTKGSSSYTFNYYFGGDTFLNGSAENELICNQFNVGTRNVPSIGKICIRAARNGFLIAPNDQTLDTVAKFKQWLTDQYNAGTPVIVVYPTSSPTTETVTGQHLHIQAGTNTVTITQASIDNLPLEVSYKGTV